MVELPAMTDWDRMAADYAVLGLSPGHHPMAFLRPQLHEGVVPSRMLESLPDGAPVEVAGLVVCRQRPGTAKGFVFLVLEDEFGLVNVVVKPDLYERAALAGADRALRGRARGAAAAGRDGEPDSGVVQDATGIRLASAAGAQLRVRTSSQPYHSTLRGSLSPKTNAHYVPIV